MAAIFAIFLILNVFGEFLAHSVINFFSSMLSECVRFDNGINIQFCLIVM